MKRAAGLHTLAAKDFPVLYSDKAKDFRECVWNLTAYTFPETISLPSDYQVARLTPRLKKHHNIFT